MRQYFIALFMVMSLLTGCDRLPSEALGTLEWDRVNGRAIQSEVIVELFVTEGDIVAIGTPLLRLDSRKQEVQVQKYEADLNQAIWQEKELQKGPRQEEIAEARARLSAADANVITTRLNYNRQKTLRTGDFTSQELLDNTKNGYLTAKAQQEERTETLNKLLAGTRIEKLEQARARVISLEALVEGAKLLLEEYFVVAARAGKVDSLPYKLGDKPPQMAIVSTILSGEAPWARVYIPEPYRSRMKVGREYQVSIDGQPEPFTVRLRSLQAKSSFTPYFALTEKDRTYLSYVAELDVIDEKAKQLGSGTPVQLSLEQL